MMEMQLYIQAPVMAQQPVRLPGQHKCVRLQVPVKPAEGVQPVPVLLLQMLQHITRERIVLLNALDAMELEHVSISRMGQQIHGDQTSAMLLIIGVTVQEDVLPLQQLKGTVAHMDMGLYQVIISVHGMAQLGHGVLLHGQTMNVRDHAATT
jgi:hypothetical protein